MINEFDILDDREEYFETHGIECTCRPGYVVCTNCQNYYKKKKLSPIRQMNHYGKRTDTLAVVAVLFAVIAIVLASIHLLFVE